MFRNRLRSVALTALIMAVGLTGCVKYGNSPTYQDLSATQQADLKKSTTPQIKGLYDAGYAPGDAIYQPENTKRWYADFGCRNAPGKFHCDGAPRITLALTKKPKTDEEKLSFDPNGQVTIEAPASTITPEYTCEVIYSGFTSPKLIWGLPAQISKIHTRDKTPVTLGNMTLTCKVAIPAPAAT